MKPRPVIELLKPLALGGLALLFVAPEVAAAAEGIVVLNRSGCRSRYVVETPMGYAILEWFGGRDPMEGEKIYGDFERYGMKQVTFANGRAGKVWVEDFWLSRQSVLEKMAKFCER